VPIAARQLHEAQTSALSSPYSEGKVVDRTNSGRVVGVLLCLRARVERMSNQPTHPGHYPQNDGLHGDREPVSEIAVTAIRAGRETGATGQVQPREKYSNLNAEMPSAMSERSRCYIRFAGWGSSKRPWKGIGGQRRS